MRDRNNITRSRTETKQLKFGVILICIIALITTIMIVVGIL